MPTKLWGPDARELAYALMVACHADRLVRECLAGRSHDPENLIDLITALYELQGHSVAGITGEQWETRAHDLLEAWPRNERALSDMREGIDFIWLD